MTLSISTFAQVTDWLRPGRSKQSHPAIWWAPGDLIVVQAGVEGDTPPAISNPHLTFNRHALTVEDNLTMVTYVAVATSHENHQYIHGCLDADNPWGFGAWVIHDSPPAMRWWKRWWLKLRRRYWRKVQLATPRPGDTESAITATRSPLKSGETDEFGWTLSEDGELLIGPPLPSYGANAEITVDQPEEGQ